MSDTKKGFALRTFSDAGEGRTYEAGKVHDFTAGQFANHEHAGLIRAAKAGDAKAEAEPAPAAAPAAKS